MTSVAEKTLNLSLRTATLFMRFLFVFFIAKHLDPEMVGKYGLFTASVAFLVLVVGLDYYTFTSREILRLDTCSRGRLLKGQVALSCILYLIVFPIVVVLLSAVGWSNVLLLWLVPIVILEHFNQEVFRLLVVLNRQIYASIVLFLRQASWAIIVVGLLIASEDHRQLNTVFLLWAVGGIAAAALGYRKLAGCDLGGWKQPVQWDWVRKGIGISATFLIGTLALRAINTTDRYWLEALSSHEFLAAYVLYFGIASALMTFLDAAVFSYTYPKLIHHFHQNEGHLANALIKRSLLQTIAFCFIFAVASWLVLPYVLVWIDNSAYQDHVELYPWLLSATILHALGMVPHYALYACGMNRYIIFSHISGFVFFTISVWALSASLSGMSVLLSVNLCFLVIFFIKIAAFLKGKSGNWRKPVRKEKG